MLLASCFLLLFCSGTASAATYYVANVAGGGNDSNPGTSAAPWRTFNRAFRGAAPVMTGGDTLIVKDGTYNESINNPPSGLGASRYTIIRAENDGSAIVRGHLPSPYPAGSCPVTTDEWYAWRHPLFIDSTLAVPVTTGSYIQIEGIKFEGGCGGIGMGAAEIRDSDHIKIFRCAFYDPSTASPNGEAGASTFALRRTHHVLVEDSWAWGYGRYKFHTYESDKIIYRRTVARHDWASTRYPQAVYTAYLSSDVEWQNAIAIDSDQNAFHYHATGYDPGVQAAFYSPRGESWGVKVLGSIALNVGGAGYYSAYFGGINEIRDSVIWHTWAGIAPSNPTTCGNGIQEGNEECDGGAGCTSYCLLSTSERVVVAPYPPSPNPPELTVDHNTIGDIYYNDTYTSGTAAGIGAFGIWGGDEITNSIITNCRNAAIASFELSDYNVFFGNPIDHTDHWCSWGCGTTLRGSHDLNEDPRIEYLVQTPRADGRGATILNRIGVSGTLWGEVGYNILTSDPLWPFPNQRRIRRDMRTFVGPSPAVCGNGRVEYGEECDGGGNCSASCLCVVDPGWSCPPSGTCRNGYLEPGEQCDDGNATSGDGCESDCRVTAGRYPDLNLGKRGFCADNMSLTKYIWEYIPGATMPAAYAECGNDAVESGEACDDGNITAGDGCDGTCRIELPPPPPPPPPVCGNGAVEGTEECDDGNTVAGDGCDDSCHREIPVCGDAVLGGTEECDDGNLIPGDGCDDTCHTEPPSPPTPLPPALPQPTPSQVPSGEGDDTGDDTGDDRPGGEGDGGEDQTDGEESGEDSATAMNSSGVSCVLMSHTIDPVTTLPIAIFFVFSLGVLFHLRRAQLG